MGPLAGLDGCGKSPPSGFDPWTVYPCSSVAIPTELTQPTITKFFFLSTQCIYLYVEQASQKKGDCFLKHHKKLEGRDYSSYRHSVELFRASFYIAWGEPLEMKTATDYGLNDFRSCSEKTKNFSDE